MDKIVDKFGRGSWQTTLCGILLLLNVVSSELMGGLENGVGDVSWAALFTAAVTAWGLFKARDNNKSSEDVGNK
jgi:hypothetical protein